MAWNYTKTALILVVGQFAVRVPIAFLFDNGIDSRFLWAGVGASLVVLPIFLTFDLVSWARRGRGSL
jgi:hypothetical protein